MKPEAARLIVEAVSRVTAFFGGDAAKAHAWFMATNPLMGGLSPIDLLCLGRHAQVAWFVRTQLAESEAPTREPQQPTGETPPTRGDRGEEPGGR